ncbi:MAG: sulfatase [Opitutales bacterium]
MSELPAPKKNVIWIFGDQHRAQAMGYAGDPNVFTPNLDNKAETGLAFSGAVGGCPLCCPFRGSLLSGRYPHHAVPGHEYPLDPALPTVATAFNAHGYRTSYFGKWHVDGWKEHDGRAGKHIIARERRGGFTDWLGYENNNAQSDCWVHGHLGEEEVELYRLPGYETDDLTDLLLNYIRERGEERARDPQSSPFFAALSVQPPHDPYVAPASFMQNHNVGGIEFRPNVPEIPWVREQAGRELAGYYAMIENLDWNVGRVDAALKAAGLDRDTHIIFFSDHGDMHGSHGQFRKTSPWEESIRVPCVIFGSGDTRYSGKGGHRLHAAPLNHVDYAPTSLGLCGLPVPDWMQGHDYSHLRLWGKQPVQSDPDSAFLQLVAPSRHADSTDRPWRGLVTTDGWKYVCLEHQPFMLFNLNEDPYELVNHAHNRAYRTERRHLQDRLAQWIADTGDTFPLPVDI